MGCQSSSPGAMIVHPQSSSPQKPVAPLANLQSRPIVSEPKVTDPKLIQNPPQRPPDPPPKPQPSTKSPPTANSLPPLLPIKKFVFKKTTQKLIPGNSSKQKSGPTNSPLFCESDCLDTFGLISLFYQNSCYTDGTFNNTNYRVQKGELVGLAVTAYRVHPPLNKASNFLASRHNVVFKVDTSEEYNVYRFEDGVLELAAKLSNPKAGSYNLIPNLTVSELNKPITFFIQPETQRVSPHCRLSEQIQGSTIYEDDRIVIEVIRFEVPEEPFTPEDFNFGPGSHENCYSPNRNFWRVAEGAQAQAQGEVVVWEGRERQGEVFVTRFWREEEVKVKTVRIQSRKGFVLGAAAGDSKYLYYTLVQSGQPKNQKDSKPMFLIKSDLQTGQPLLESKIPTTKQHCNIFSFDTCNLSLNSKSLAMVVSRRMTQSDDGLNHQGAWACIFDTETLQISKVLGQTSSHSFANSLVRLEDGRWMGMDLGDNYPRGINCWLFDTNSITKRLIYTFKTLHSQQSKSPSGVSHPQYHEISTPKQKFFKWSNDNRTYTQLASPGIIQTLSSSSFFFCSQNLPTPLDNSKTGAYCNCSRNIGYVKIAKELTQCNLSDEILQGGFFTFGGTWQKQTMRGVKWLTRFSGEESASRVKTGRLGENILVVFEVWNKTSYLNTQYILVRPDGTSTEPIKLEIKLRLHKSDDVFGGNGGGGGGGGGSVVFYAGEKGKLINRYQIRAK